MREEIAAFELKQKPVFQDLYKPEDNITFDDHLKKIDQDRAWGTELEVTAAATLFNIILATDKTGTTIWGLYSPSDKIEAVPQTNIPVRKYLKVLKDPWIEIVLVNDNHFDAIEPINFGECLPRPQLTDEGKNT